MASQLDQWTALMRKRLAGEPKAVKDDLYFETDRLRDQAQSLAAFKTGRLRRSIKSKGLIVLSRHPAALFQNKGGILKAKKHEFMTIPVRPGFRRAPKYVTIKRADGSEFVIRRGTTQLWAVKRRAIVIAGNRYLDRALDRHLGVTGDRVSAKVATRLVTP